jgi:murein DD-endopeptidase MepM/ murein hydrolase activator NlpD
MKIVLPVPATEIRSDPAGSGAFKASRVTKVKGKAANRIHKGIDLVCDPGDLVVAPITGKVFKIGYPYATDLDYRYVEIRNGSGLSCRVFYVEPDVVKGQMVEAGERIGHAQDVSAHYKFDSRGGIRYRTNKMLPHVHLEFRTSSAHIATNTVEKYCYLDAAMFFGLE